MGPTLILDKSAFHALSSHEMHKIAEYFCWNRLDILLLEIIGDFSKQIKTTSSRNEAAILADKVSLFDSYQNVDYTSLFLGNLLGEEVVMDGRPIIAPDTINKLENGSVGALIDDTRFCEMIYGWQRGDFNKEDAALSELWQGVKDDCKEKAINYLDLLTTNHIVFPTCTSIIELEAEVAKLIRNPKVQFVLLNMLLSYQGI